MPTVRVKAHTRAAPAKRKAKGKPKSRGISTGYDPKTGKVGYTRSVKPKRPAKANYAS